MFRFQELIDVTFRDIWTRDRKTGSLPEALVLESVTDVHNDTLWIDYMARQEVIRRELTANVVDFFRVEVDSASDESHVMQELPGPKLDGAVNEVLLFHGTSNIAAEAITTHDFRINLAGSNAGSLYGRGVYLAENSSKSDEYAREDANGLCTLILCRCTLGRVFYTAEVSPDPRACEAACIHNHFHSVLGDRRACRNTYREFILFDEEQIYPNYILQYRRRMKAKVSG